MTRQEFEAWVSGSVPGQQATYHVGSLMYHRQKGIRFQEVANVATAAWDAMEAGKVTLVQRTVARSCHEYIAIKRAEPFKPVLWEGCMAEAAGYRTGNKRERAHAA